MRSHPEAGALGVKMINGNGKLLPESKRALPTPATAFFKMAGLSWLFPKSRFFNRYYLGHLDSSDTSEADVLSGAFMFIRKAVLEKTGLLDESFFMYGEDIDLSYRIIKAGFKNYYFPEVSIVHYKGESTRKSDINNIVHFYRAMLIFIRKNFGGERGISFLLPVWIAVYFWGLVSIIKNLFRKIFLPLTDALVLSLLLIIIIPLWEKFKFSGEYGYPGFFSLVIIPAFTLVNIFSIFLAGGYRLPSKAINVLKGILSGTAVILVVYALLPQDMRFSRAILVISSISSILILPFLRIVMAVAGIRLVENPIAKARKTIIVSNEEEYRTIGKLLAETTKKHLLSGRVSINPEDIGTEVLGSLDQLTEVIRINRIDDVIFSAKHLSASQIINLMHLLSKSNVTIKMVPSGEKLIIGSNSVNLRKDR
jgi:O-antigen biosynthesis protein